MPFTDVTSFDAAEVDGTQTPLLQRHVQNVSTLLAIATLPKLGPTASKNDLLNPIQRPHEIVNLSIFLHDLCEIKPCFDTCHIICRRK
jgi:hypothetical protein